MRVQKTFEFVAFLDKTWHIDVELVYDIEEERIDTYRGTETQLVPILRKLHIEELFCSGEDGVPSEVYLDPNPLLVLELENHLLDNYDAEIKDVMWDEFNNSYNQDEE